MTPIQTKSVVDLDGLIAWSANHNARVDPDRNANDKKCGCDNDPTTDSNHTDELDDAFSLYQAILDERRDHMDSCDNSCGYVGNTPNCALSKQTESQHQRQRLDGHMMNSQSVHHNSNSYNNHNSRKKEKEEEEQKHEATTTMETNEVSALPFSSSRIGSSMIMSSTKRFPPRRSSKRKP